MFVFREIWRALFSCNTRFEIRPFAYYRRVTKTDISYNGKIEINKEF